MYHYQDYNNNEMDAVIAMPDGKWCGFEIKLGANQIDMAAENLIKIKMKLKQVEELRQIRYVLYVDYLMLHIKDLMEYLLCRLQR